MTREEKQKAIDALKKSVPVMAVTQEEFKDYIQTLNKIMDWLEQEPNYSEIPTGSTTKNCRSCKNFGTHHGICDICRDYGCWTEKEHVLDKLRAEIERQEKWLMDAGYNAYNVDIAFNAVKLAVDKYRAESEEL